eukprot:6193709-Pleurochrysis_carterae.AAC.7
MSICPYVHKNAPGATGRPCAPVLRLKTAVSFFRSTDSCAITVRSSAFSVTAHRASIHQLHARLDSTGANVA